MTEALRAQSLPAHGIRLCQEGLSRDVRPVAQAEDPLAEESQEFITSWKQNWNAPPHQQMTPLINFAAEL